MTVLPVVKTLLFGTPSASRLFLLTEVGAKSIDASLVVRQRFSSSGNGLSMFPVRRPASRWKTGTR